MWYSGCRPVPVRNAGGIVPACCLRSPHVSLPACHQAGRHSSPGLGEQGGVPLALRPQTWLALPRFGWWLPAGRGALVQGGQQDAARTARALVAVAMPDMVESRTQAGGRPGASLAAAKVAPYGHRQNQPGYSRVFVATAATHTPHGEKASRCAPSTSVQPVPTMPPVTGLPRLTPFRDHCPTSVSGAATEAQCCHSC